MKAKINLDEKSVIAANGELYDLAGVLVRANKTENADAKDKVYDMNSSFARACIWKEREVDILVIGDKQAYIL